MHFIIYRDVGTMIPSGTARHSCPRRADSTRKLAPRHACSVIQGDQVAPMPVTWQYYPWNQVFPTVMNAGAHPFQ